MWKHQYDPSMTLRVTARIVIKDCVNKLVDHGIDLYWRQMSKPDEPLRHTMNRIIIGGVVANIFGTLIAATFVLRRLTRKLTRL